MIAGTRFRGDLEERFKAVVGALSALPKPILFVDEMHSMVGAGAVSGGTIDFATLLKPLLSAGELRIVGSTTFEEFKQIEKDRALARRLQKVAIEEPSIADTVKILAGLRSRYRSTTASVTRTRRWRRPPNWRHGICAITACPIAPSISMDEAGAVTRLQTLAAGPPPDGSADVLPVVDARDIERVAARAARIPDQQATSSDRERLRTLEDSLQRVVFGQGEAVHAVAQAIKRSRAGLAQPERPAGCFLFTGPTGVGKTELAKQLGLLLGNQFIRFDMSGYMEKHAVARLIGAPPGYVGFEQGGLLVDAVRTHPYCVVLLDEIEKAHPDIYNILLQVMDHADADGQHRPQGRFPERGVILTSNAGSREMSAQGIGFAESGAGGDDIARGRTAAGKAKTALERVFSPEFRNRLDAIVTFKSLTPEAMETIVDKFIMQLESQLSD